MQRLFGVICLILTLPFYPIIFVAIKLNSPGPYIFQQKRMGKNKKIFTMYKFRTMVNNAEKLKIKYLTRNEADGPAFKIRNDPRYTKVGKLLAHLAIDELPQLLNVIRGEMAFVGPRPLPISEAKQIPKKYEVRFSVLPGLTSLWVIQGSHKLSFNKWMELDCEYVKIKNIWVDIVIVIQTMLLLIKSFPYL